ncbi:MAG: DUF4202 domain-containing protein [Acidimicrobiales bacterium]
MTETGDFNLAIAAIDKANTEDPHTLTIDGKEQPKELVHASMMTAWVKRLDPDASEVQLLAARAHHIRRWSLFRTDFAEGRAGYLQWRTALGKQHAQDLGVIMAEAGYSDELIAAGQKIVRKQGRTDDKAVQTHEDALCLVFLETQSLGLTRQLGDEKMVAVAAKTLAKMSPEAQGEALRLDLDERVANVVLEALGRTT